MWEKHGYAQDGSFIRLDRQCVKGNGEPKRQFDTIEDAEHCARSMSVPEGKRGRRYKAYQCDASHIHVGRDLK